MLGEWRVLCHAGITRGGWFLRGPSKDVVNYKLRFNMDGQGVEGKPWKGKGWKGGGNVLDLFRGWSLAMEFGEEGSLDKCGLYAQGVFSRECRVRVCL